MVIKDLWEDTKGNLKNMNYHCYIIIIIIIIIIITITAITNVRSSAPRYLLHLEGFYF